jgi:hypothetical protein
LEEYVTYIFRVKEPLIAACFMLVSCLAYFLTLKMEATGSSKTSVDFQQTTEHYIPEDITECHNNMNPKCTTKFIA